MLLYSLLNFTSERKCRNGVPKSTQTRKDDSDAKYTKPIHPYIFSQKNEDVETGLCIFTITFILPCLPMTVGKRNSETLPRLD